MARPAGTDPGATADGGWWSGALRRLRGGGPAATPAGPWRVEGAQDGPPRGAGEKRRLGGFWWIVALLLLLNWLVTSTAMEPPARSEISYSFFTEQVEAGNVESVTSSADRIDGELQAPVAYRPGSGEATQVDRFSTRRPAFASDDLLARLEAEDVVVDATAPDDGPPVWAQLLLGFGPTLLLVGLFVWFLRRRASAAGGPGGLGALGGFGRSRASLYQPDHAARTTFADVAGIDEVEQQVTELVDFLREPQRYTRVGARIPRGVLLSGPPGTGKTLLARAVAGEARVPFFSIAASEFIEAIVGVGASRVRDLFTQAKQVAPAIVFIDELDAIGRARGGSAFSAGGSDEREQTLNQILTEMDGFQGNEGVVVLAATNRPEILDRALLRPGRFDRRVAVSPPDQAGRRQILEVHTRAVPVSTDVDLAALAATTPGMVGADLANLVNEAALRAAQRGRDVVTADDFAQALEGIVLGAVRGIVLSPDDRRRTAYHEAGHALLGMLGHGGDPVRRVTIIPRGQALGVTVQTPRTDRYGYTAGHLRGRIVVALGGRAAEDVVFDDATTGAESDLQQATSVARQMVGRWGMSEAIGPVSVLPPPGDEQPFGLDGVAPATKELVDQEVRRLLDDCYREAVTTLRTHRLQLERLATALLREESLAEAEAYAAAGIPTQATPADAPGAAAAVTAVGAPTR
jgi:cell division protease FtsH